MNPEALLLEDVTPINPVLAYMLLSQENLQKISRITQEALTTTDPFLKTVSPGGFEYVIAQSEYDDIISQGTRSEGSIEISFSAPNGFRVLANNRYTLHPSNLLPNLTGQSLTCEKLDIDTFVYQTTYSWQKSNNSIHIKFGTSSDQDRDHMFVSCSFSLQTNQLIRLEIRSQHYPFNLMIQPLENDEYKIIFSNTNFDQDSELNGCQIGEYILGILTDQGLITAEDEEIVIGNQTKSDSGNLNSCTLTLRGLDNLSERVQALMLKYQQEIMQEATEVTETAIESGFIAFNT